MHDVDELVAVALGARGPARAPGARVAARAPTPPRRRRVGGGDRSSPLVPQPTTSRLSPARRPPRSKARSTQASGSTKRRALGVEAVERRAARRRGRPARGRCSAKPPGSSAGRAELLAQRLVAAAAAPALAARRVVVHDDAVAGARRPSTSAPTAVDLAGQLVAEHRRHLARDPRVADVRAAHPAREHAARRRRRGPGSGSGRLLDADLARRERARDPHASSAATDAVVGRRATPRSVTSAVTSSAGVTSKAGLRTAVPGSVVATAAERAHLVAVALLDLDARRRRAASGRSSRSGPATTNGMPAARGGQGQADRCRPCWRRRRWRRRGRSRRSTASTSPRRDQPGDRRRRRRARGARRRARAPRRSAARPAAAAASRRRAPCDAAARVQLEDHRERGAAAAGGQRAGVAVGERSARAPASRSAPCVGDRRRARRPPRRGCACASARAAAAIDAVPARQRRRADAVDGVGEVDGGRPRAERSSSQPRSSVPRPGRRATSIASP